MLQVGLTGGIACGKSTVARMLQDKGAYLIDFDLLAHFVEEPGRPAWKSIVEYFGSEILNGDGKIDRVKLGAIVFTDKKKLSKLNEIVHPATFEEWHHRIEEIKKDAPDAIIVSDVPLLVEGNFQSLFDLVALVYTSPEEQVQRLMTRNGYSREEALARLASQMSIDDKVKYADIVINNQGTVEDTRRIINGVWEEFLDRERKGRKN